MAKSWTDEQQKEIADYRDRGYGDGYLSWMFGCTESELPPKQDAPKAEPKKQASKGKQAAKP